MSYLCAETRCCDCECVKNMIFGGFAGVFISDGDDHDESFSEIALYLHLSICFQRLSVVYHGYHMLLASRISRIFFCVSYNFFRDSNYLLVEILFLKMLHLSFLPPIFF